MGKYKTPKLQKNIEIIAQDFLNFTGAKDLHDLKENYPYFHEKYMEEKNRVGGFSKEKEKKELVPIHRINFANLVDRIYLCEKCKKELIFIIHKKKLFYQDTIYKYKDGILKMQCICGEVNTINFTEKDKVSDKVVGSDENGCNTRD